MSTRPDLVEGFLNLFISNPRNHGVLVAAVKGEKKQHKTVAGAITLEVMAAHLDGVTSIGGIPVLDDDTCYWGAVDVDAEVDFVKLDAEINQVNLPFLACKSPSGRAHLFVFMAEPTPAKALRHWLEQSIKKLTLPAGSVDKIFPANTTLRREDGTLAVGNFINLPYFKQQNTTRGCMLGSKALGLQEFISLAKQLRMSLLSSPVSVSNTSGHLDAPPCIQYGIAHGVKEGGRNEWAYNLAVYLKKRYSNAYRDHFFAITGQTLSPKLPVEELKNLAKLPRNYHYRCNAEPCSSWCDKNSCLKKQYGIKAGEILHDEDAKKLVFTAAIRYLTDPPQIGLKIEGVPKEIITDAKTMFRYTNFRPAVFEQTSHVLPTLDAQEWEVKLKEIASIIQDVEVSPEAEYQGAVQEELMNYLQLSEVLENDDLPARQERLQRYVPFVQKVDGEVRTYFSLSKGFVPYLVSIRSNSHAKRGSFHLALKSIGVVSARMETSDKTVNIRYLKGNLARTPSLPPNIRRMHEDMGRTRKALEELDNLGVTDQEELNGGETTFIDREWADQADDDVGDAYEDPEEFGTEKEEG